ncbi:hypothetical protein BCS42_12325 [Crenothrix sp. D3]|jgi:hypothetical protein|nr:hypothetical protein BCS42_12325 [Crenothrix sp. D3]
MQQLYNINSMNKIQTALKNQCLADPKEPVSVIVTGFITPEKAKQIGLDSIAGLDNIYSGSLLGENILTIAELEAIDSIELDADVGML